MDSFGTDRQETIFKLLLKIFVLTIMKKVVTKTFLKIAVFTLATIFSTGDTYSQSTNDTTFFIHSFANDLAENPVGTYTHFVKSPKQLDSLVIKRK